MQRYYWKKNRKKGQKVYFSYLGGEKVQVCTWRFYGYNVLYFKSQKVIKPTIFCSTLFWSMPLWEHKAGFFWQKIPTLSVFCLDDFIHHNCGSINNKMQVNPSDVIIIEGILVLHDHRVRDIMSMKIFVDTGSFYCLWFLDHDWIYI